MLSIRALLRIVALVGAATGFLFALGLISSAGTTLGQSTLERVLTMYSGPVTGLCIGLVATSIFQSSSATTSIVVALVAGGGLPLSSAVPVILGANIGTTLTSTLAAFGSSTIPAEFSRALSAAAIHVLFNLTLSLILLPLEIAFGVVTGLAVEMSQLLSPLLGSSSRDVSDLTTLDYGLPPWGLMLAGILLLILSLRLGISLLRSVVLKRSEHLMETELSRHPILTFGAGFGLTAVVQSSSLTTSLIVPLAGSGIWKPDRVLPYTLGANVGTTVTALLAALTTGSSGDMVNPALTAACAHVLINVTGFTLVGLIPPLRRAILAGAALIGRMAEQRRRSALAYVIGLFFVAPTLILLVLISLR